MPPDPPPPLAAHFGAQNLPHLVLKSGYSPGVCPLILNSKLILIITLSSLQFVNILFMRSVKSLVLVTARSVLRMFLTCKMYVLL